MSKRDMEGYVHIKLLKMKSKVSEPKSTLQKKTNEDIAKETIQKIKRLEQKQQRISIVKQLQTA